VSLTTFLGGGGPRFWISASPEQTYGTVGAIAALWLMGQPFGFMAFLGIASLVGVIVSHVIVLFDFIEEAHAHGEPLEQALLDAGILRLRPVLITVGATVIALVPLAAHGGPLWEGLCYAQIGGLLVATVVTLLIVPVLYAIVVRDLKWVKWEPVGAPAEEGLPRVALPGPAAVSEPKKTSASDVAALRDAEGASVGGVLEGSTPGSGCQAGRLFRQDDMGGVVRGGVLRASVAEAHRIDAGEEVLATAEEHGGDHEVDLVGQPRGQVLANGGNPTAESDILAVGRLHRASQRGMDAIGHEVERRSALHGDGRTSMVRQHEDRYVIGRVVAPPPLPAVVGPGAPHRPEHVAA
jgi:uncharacterized membrane protein